ncbi:putative transcriptional regulatory protein [Habropoda laboriosa]|uniref:Putative transcriptional regulatory protein n=1 Tax=Habropoda laboriosa TaxID=597456 RepID=A0A0L7QN53_9HYME|nr:PREDICTED: probable transcriptional regulatory protein OEOE_0768 [Habropoda laboriosa]KOC59994.1 putative transcriptional regulatory protein [Habropoda laboriosa]
MSYRLNILLFNECKNFFIQETRRYAGHSKWQNIKATKQSQDTAKSIIFNSLASKIKKVVVESGNADPDTNSKLAGLITQAKKINMPATTLKAILDRIQNVQSNDFNSQTEIVTIRTSTGITLIIYIASNSLAEAKPLLNNLVKKARAKTADVSVLSMFDCASYVTASRDCNLDQAMENAIEINAQDVEEVKHDDKTCFMFKSEFLFPEKAATQLTNLGYTILSIDNKCVPITVIEVSEEELENINKFKHKLQSCINGVIKIEDNIAPP